MSADHERPTASPPGPPTCVVGVGALIMLAPFYFMFVFATHSRTEIFSLPPPLFFGDDFLDNLKILTERCRSGATWAGACTWRWPRPR